MSAAAPIGRLIVPRSLPVTRLAPRIDSRPMVLSDRTIKSEIAAGRIALDPFDETMVQPSSVDVRVDRSFRVFHNARYPFIDVRQPMEELTESVEISDADPFILHPGEFVLGQTLERVRLPDDIVARLEGKSSLGRLGLLIHRTAGFVDAGFEGNLTLELSNVANLPVTIYYGMPIGRSHSCAWTPRSSGPMARARQGASTRARTSPPRVAFTSTSSTDGRRAAVRDRDSIRPASTPLPSRDAKRRTLEMVVVLVIALVIFGPKRLPELGRSVGKGIREFKTSVSGYVDDDDEDDPPPKPAQIEGERTPAPSPSRGGRSRTPQLEELCPSCGRPSSTTS